MPEYETIPAEENALQPKASIRRVIVCAAALSFVLGAIAATAVGSTSTPGANVGADAVSMCGGELRGAGCLPPPP